MKTPVGILAVMTVLTLTAHAPAAVFTVTSTLDAVDAAPGDGSCATASGTCTLRAAVQEADGHPGPDVIMMPAGFFQLTIYGPNEDVAATGDLDVYDPLEIHGAGMDLTVIDGNLGDRLFHTDNPLTLADLTLQQGRATFGGAVAAVFGAGMTVTRVRFVSNQSSAGPGGALSQTDGSLVVADSEFRGNYAYGGDGGALAFAGTGNPSVSNTTFSANTAIGGDGGGANLQATGNVSISGGLFARNAAYALVPGGEGGGAFVTATGTVTVTGAQFIGNQAPEQGGGLEIQGAPTVVLDHLIFDGNLTSSSGGGLLSNLTGSVTLTAITATNNVGRYGGGGYVSANAVRASGSEFSDNVAFDGAGGGLYFLGLTTAVVEGSVFRRNVCGNNSGGGLYLDGMQSAATDVEASDNVGLHGAGVYLFGTVAEATRLRLTGNVATYDGGGLGLTADTGTLTDSTLDGNTAAKGGGLEAVVTALTIAGSTISNNRASGLGGGANLSATSGTVMNSTFSGNAADAGGGGASVFGSLVLRSVTLADNAAPTGQALFAGKVFAMGGSIVTGGAGGQCAGLAITSLGFNVDSTASCGLAGPGDQTADAQLGPLQDNGGPTFTRLPGPTSPAIDRGDPAACPATDQRGQARPTDGNGDGTAACDAGAVEFLDLCPTDPAKAAPGTCGCGVADTDADLPNGVADCLVNGEFKARLASIRAIVAVLTGDPSQAGAEQELTSIASGLSGYIAGHKGSLVLTNPKAKLPKLVRRASKKIRRAVKVAAGRRLERAKKAALAATDALDAAVAPQG